MPFTAEHGRYATETFTPQLNLSKLKQLVNNDFHYRTPKKMAIMWSFGAFVLVLFALVPWLTHARALPPIQVAILFTIWSMPSLTLAAFLVYYSWRTVTTTIDGDTIHRSSCFLGWSRSNFIKPIRIFYAVYLQHHKNRADEEVEGIIIRTHSKKVWFETSYSCDAIQDLFNWLNLHAQFDCRDIRKRAILDQSNAASRRTAKRPG